MSDLNLTSHPQILHFPKGGKPALAANEWQAWSGDQNKSEEEERDLFFKSSLR